MYIRREPSGAAWRKQHDAQLTFLQSVQRGLRAAKVMIWMICVERRGEMCAPTRTTSTETQENSPSSSSSSFAGDAPHVLLSVEASLPTHISSCCGIICLPSPSSGDRGWFLCFFFFYNIHYFICSRIRTLQQLLNSCHVGVGRVFFFSGCGSIRLWDTRLDRCDSVDGWRKPEADHVVIFLLLLVLCFILFSLQRCSSGWATFFIFTVSGCAVLRWHWLCLFFFF